jgi:hypothetical protein
MIIKSYNLRTTLLNKGMATSKKRRGKNSASMT